MPRRRNIHCIEFLHRRPRTTASALALHSLMPFNETPKHAEKVIASPQRTTSVSDLSALVMRIWVQQQEPATALPTTVNERAITTTIVVNRQRIKLMSVYFPHLGYADHHIEKMYKTIEKHTANCKRYIPIVGGDFNAELDPDTEQNVLSVGRYTLNKGNKRGDWMKHWLMLLDYTALNTMYRKTLGKLRNK